MSDLNLNRLLYRPPVRPYVGFLAGFLFGTLIANLLIRAPTSEWLRAYPDYVEIRIIFTIFGSLSGLVVGLVVTLFTLRLQLRRGERSGPRYETWATEPKKPFDQLEQRTKSDERISHKTDIAGSME